MLPPKKTYFAMPEELHTPEYREYVQWTASVWKANDERNRRIEQEKQRIQELDDIALINEGEYA